MYLYFDCAVQHAAQPGIEPTHLAVEAYLES